MVRDITDKDVSKVIEQEKQGAFNRISDDRLLTGIKNKLNSIKPQPKLNKLLRPIPLLSSCLVIVVIGTLIWLTWSGETTREKYIRIVSRVIKQLPYFKEQGEEEIPKTTSNELENLLRYTLLSSQPRSTKDHDITGYLATVLKDRFKKSGKNIKEEQSRGDNSSLFYIFYKSLKTMEDYNES
jgi:hypothetical protein